MKEKKYTFHITGTHCASCKILIEDILKEQDFIKSAYVNLKKKIFKFKKKSEKSAEEIIAILNPKIKPNGYTLSVNTPEARPLGYYNDEVIWKAIPIGLVFLAIFFMLQKSGIL